MLIDLIRDGFSKEAVLMLLLSLPSVLIALTFHEVSHGYAAYRLGDPTARNHGRLSLNPIKHLDPLGFLCMMLFGFGWAKPVPINTRYFKKMRRDTALTAAAGPLANFLLGVIAALVSRGVFGLFNTFILPHSDSTFVYYLGYAAYLLFYVLSMLSFSLGLFNLIPVPPFDGSRIFLAFLPDKWYLAAMKYERYIMIAVLVLLYLDIIPFNVGSIAGWCYDLIFNIF